MRIIGSNPRPQPRAKAFNEGTGFMNALKTAFQPGEGKTGALGYFSSALGIAGENQLRKRAGLESDAMGVDVASKERILERAAVMPEISRMGLDETQRKLEKSEEEDASTLATLIESGMSPAEANNVLSQNRDNRTNALLTQLNQMDSLQNQQNANQKALTDAAFADLEKSKVAQEQFDILGQDKANTDFLFAMGTQASQLEGMVNPQAPAPNGNEQNTRGAKLAERGYKHGGITPGPHDHDVLNLIISHEDGTPALDGDGDEMHVTGSEAIIPDYIFEELMAAAKAGDKNALFEIFMDEIATEERFQV
jgi:hypothetical protein